MTYPPESNLNKGLRCPWDTGLPYFDRQLCTKDTCDTMCPWRYDIDGNRPKELEMGMSTKPREVIGEKKPAANACLVPHHCESCSNKIACDEQEAEAPIPIMAKENLGRPQYLAIMRKGECMGCPNYQLKLIKVVVSIEKIERKPAAMTYSWHGEYRGDVQATCEICGKPVYNYVDRLSLFYDNSEHPDVRDVETYHGRCYEKNHEIDWTTVSCIVDDKHDPRIKKPEKMLKKDPGTLRGKAADKPKKVDITKCLVHMKGEACPGIDSKKCLNMKNGIPCPTHPHITKYLKPKKETPDLRSLGEKILEKVGMGSHSYSDLEYNLKTDKFSLKPAVQQLVKDGRLRWVKNKLVLPEREKPCDRCAGHDEETGGCDACGGSPPMLKGDQCAAYVDKPSEGPCKTCHHLATYPADKDGKQRGKCTNPKATAKGRVIRAIDQVRREGCYEPQIGAEPKPEKPKNKKSKWGADPCCICGGKGFAIYKDGKTYCREHVEELNVKPITAETTKEGIVVKVPEKTLEHIEKGGEAPETVVKESRVRICSFEVLPAKEEPTPKIIVVQKTLFDYPQEA